MEAADARENSGELEKKKEKEEGKEGTMHDLSFYGLGWDFESRHFKLYLMVHGLPDGLPDRYGALAKTQLAAAGIDIARVQVEQHGLISLTFHNDENACVGFNGGVCGEEEGSSNTVAGTSILHEEKVYVYPTASTTAALGQSIPGVTALDGKTTANVAWLLASKRGFVAQVWVCQT